jgi:DNA-binding transcriptional MerR regulator
MLSDETFTIAETARRTGLTTHTLRYYEQQGLMLDWVKRADSTHRRYSAGAIAWIDFLTKLRSTGTSIRRMREDAQLVGEGEGNELERLALLDEHRANVRAQLTSMQGTLAELEAKIALYRDAPVPPIVANASSPVSSAESAHSRAASSR